MSASRLGENAEPPPLPSRPVCTCRWAGKWPNSSSQVVLVDGTRMPKWRRMLNPPCLTVTLPPSRLQLGFHQVRRRHAIVRQRHLARAADHSANPIEVPVPSKPAGKASRSLHPIGFEGLAAVVPFLDQGFAHAEAMAFNRRTPIGPHADLREAGDLLGKF